MAITVDQMIDEVTKEANEYNVEEAKKKVRSVMKEIGNNMGLIKKLQEQNEELRKSLKEIQIVEHTRQELGL